MEVKDTDIVDVTLHLTGRQARYLARKLGDLAKAKRNAARKGRIDHEECLADAMMLEGLRDYLRHALHSTRIEHIPEENMRAKDGPSEHPVIDSGGADSSA